MDHTPIDIGGPYTVGSLELRTRGRWPLPPVPVVAIVGARRRTPYGEAVAERLAADLARQGIVVLSSLAPGIESAAHEGAIEADGCTVAVLGTGIDVTYPSAVAALAERILSAGGTLVSAFPDGRRPQSGYFPCRNLAIATLADVMVVVEATVNSGALITARAAIALGKPVMAVPGSVFSPLSVGCHQLLRDGARLVQNASSILAELNVREVRS